MKKATVILAHPRMSSSYANKEIIRQIDRQMPEVEVRDIASLYPDFQIDVQAEQKRSNGAEAALLNCAAFIPHPFEHFFNNFGLNRFNLLPTTRLKVQS
jgi:hypothetical protein